MPIDDIKSLVIYKDDLMLVLNKPGNIPVHPGSKFKVESLEDYFEELQFGYKETPKLAHRLDRDTSGCLILGRNLRALRKLGRLFESNQITKTYWAVVEGTPPADTGTIDMPLAKIKLPKGWSMQPAKPGTAGSQTAVTDYKVIKRLDAGRTFLELSPRTGRTHQLRVHCQAMGFPIMGDWLYGPNEARGEFPQLMLHARSISIPLYPEKPPVFVEAEPPTYIKSIFDV